MAVPVARRLSVPRRAAHCVALPTSGRDHARAFCALRRSLAGIFLRLMLVHDGVEGGAGMLIGAAVLDGQVDIDRGAVRTDAARIAVRADAEVAEVMPAPVEEFELPTP